jgi:hypothetical protein
VKERPFDSCSFVKSGAGSCCCGPREPILMADYTLLVPPIHFDSFVLAPEYRVNMVGVLAGGIVVDSGMIPETFLCCLVQVAGALI